MDRRTSSPLSVHRSIARISTPKSAVALRVERGQAEPRDNVDYATEDSRQMCAYVSTSPQPLSSWSFVAADVESKAGYLDVVLLAHGRTILKVFASLTIKALPVRPSLVFR